MNKQSISDTGYASRFRTYALLFVLAAAALACANWVAIRTVNFESGDFAANTLLILDAKRFHLIHGNYSRVGFNHPGPAILYVLAFGEMLFHDLLHIVPSPFSGQVLAADLYNAGWLVLIVAMVRRMTGNLAPALLFTAIAVLVLAYSDGAILNSMWFPHLYVLPYAAMLVAIAPLVHGRVHSLNALAVASGFLINGHASFIPTLGVVLVVVVAVNFWLSRRDRAMRILSRAWLAGHRRTVLAAVAILFLFFLPLIIATVTEFPGPLYQYYKFGHGNKGNTLREAFKFVGVYWGLGHGAPARGGVVWGLALLLAMLVGLRRLPAGFARDARALGIVFIAATLALLYYAKVGVDMLNEVYIALFYYSVPALAAGLLAVIAWRALGWERNDLAVGALALLALAGSWRWVGTMRIDMLHFYNHPQVVDLYGQMRKLPGEGRIVLDLNPDTADWGEVWSNTLSLLAYAKRQGTDFACINENWHISFTRALQCRPEEAASQRRYFVSYGDAPDPARGEPDAEALHLALYRAGAARPPLDYASVKSQPAFFRQILGKGWTAVEGDFVWSEGPLAQLRLPADPQRTGKVTLYFGSFIPNTQVRMNVQAFVNGKPGGTWTFDATELRRRITLDLGPDPAVEQHIAFKIDKPLRPVDFKLSPDARLLGISLYGIKKEVQ